ncbi:Fatty acid synthase [Trichinella spiralis]|uniref:Fatty acid synthase n=1 Tax=Trichinella spiralis TaxID=6334 RepID=A0ABR3KSR4_TRISP
MEKRLLSKSKLGGTCVGFRFMLPNKSRTEEKVFDLDTCAVLFAHLHSGTSWANKLAPVEQPSRLDRTKKMPTERHHLGRSLCHFRGHISSQFDPTGAEEEEGGAQVSNLPCC